MTDPIAAPEAELTPASPTPVITAEEIDKLIERKAQERSDQRVAGLQSVFDKKLSAIQAEIRKSNRQSAGLDDEDPRVAELEAELAQARREAAMERAAGKYPDAFPLYKQIIDIEDPDAQLAALTQWAQQQRTPLTPVVTPEPEPQAPPTPPVDLNNPPRQQVTGVDVAVIDGKSVAMNADFVQRALGFLPNQLKRG